MQRRDLPIIPSSALRTFCARRTPETSLSTFSAPCADRNEPPSFENVFCSSSATQNANSAAFRCVEKAQIE